MKIKLLENEYAIHLCMHSRSEQWPRNNMEEIWDDCLLLLGECSHLTGVKITAFTLMKNHFHCLVLISGFSEGLSSIEFFHNMSAVLDPSGLSWGGFNQFEDSFDHISNYQETYRYILRNPINAGLVEKAEDYAYSSLPYLLGYRQEKHPFFDDMHFCLSPFSNLRWVNQNHYTFYGANYAKKTTA